MTALPGGPDPRKHLNATVVHGEPRVLMVVNDHEKMIQTVYLNQQGFYQTRTGDYVRISHVGKVKQPTEWTEIELDAPDDERPTDTQYK